MCIRDRDSIVHDIMGRLQEKGIQTAMDDFGMGYSSLFELKNTPADIVKIDKGFVNGLTTDLFTATFIRSITELCHDVGKTVCLEGVKTVSYTHLDVYKRQPLLIEVKLPTQNTDICVHLEEQLRGYTGPYLIQSFN